MDSHIVNDDVDRLALHFHSLTYQRSLSTLRYNCNRFHLIHSIDNVNANYVMIDGRYVILVHCTMYIYYN